MACCVAWRGMEVLCALHWQVQTCQDFPILHFSYVTRMVLTWPLMSSRSRLTATLLCGALRGPTGYQTERVKRVRTCILTQSPMDALRSPTTCRYIECLSGAYPPALTQTAHT